MRCKIIREKYKEAISLCIKIFADIWRFADFGSPSLGNIDKL